MTGLFSLEIASCIDCIQLDGLIKDATPVFINVYAATISYSINISNNKLRKQLAD